MSPFSHRPRLPLLFTYLAAPCLCLAQFTDNFDRGDTEQWERITGDGAAEIEFLPMDEFARIQIDATQDKHNVWWAIIKRDVSGFLDLDLLKDPSYELRVEARVRVSEAPRRLNFMVNTQRTVDFHEQLREFDIPDAEGWHTISMTTRNLDATTGDALFVQLAATDWGLEKYHVDVDYYRADIINTSTAGPDKGEPLLYHPPVPAIETFEQHLLVTHDAVINTEFPDVNFHGWRAGDPGSEERVLTVTSNQWAILRWDLDMFKDAEVEGTGVLELTTHSVALGGNYIGVYGQDLGEEFGKIRLFEIFGGDPDWDQSRVTLQKFTQGLDPTAIVNSQTTFDVALSGDAGGKTFLTISRPVMQRLLNGTTRGFAIRPLGAVSASIYDSEDASEAKAPKLHFNTKP